MKTIACELCGSDDVVKQGEYFVCQSCGAKYEPEAAKKLIGSTVLDSNSTERVVRFDLEYQHSALDEARLTDAQYQELLAFIRGGGDKIAVIKRVMEYADMGLKEAKDYTEKVLYPAAESDVQYQVALPGVIPMTDVQYQELLDIIRDSGDKIAVIKRLRELTGMSLKDAKDYTEQVLYPETGVSPSARKGGCYVATAVYGSYDCPEVWTLRRYRDDRLALNPLGRLFIRAYYAISPTLIRVFGETEWFRSIGRAGLDRFVRRLWDEGYSSLPYEDRAW